MPRRALAALGVMAVVVTLAVLALTRSQPSVAIVDGMPSPQPVTTATATPAGTPTPLPSETVTPTPEPSPTETPLTPEELAAIEARRVEVVAIQTRLTELRYYADAIDGAEGPRTRAAVMAFQKVNGLGADGDAGPITIAALDQPVSPTLRGGEPDRIEVDLTLQVAYIVRADELIRTVPVSSGSGETYETKSGGQATALTPVGDFRILRRITGERKADLGILYDPLYIYKGWALHGSNHVPAHPASHGCVRLTRWDATWIASQFANGAQVRIYGGTHTFPIGSDAPGTDNPGGDTEPDAEVPVEEQEPDPSTSPSPQESPDDDPDNEPVTVPLPNGDPSDEPSDDPSDVPSDQPSDEPEPSPSSDPSPSDDPTDPSDEGSIPPPSDDETPPGGR